MRHLPVPPRPLAAVSRYASALEWISRTLWDMFRWRVVGAVATAQIGVLIVGAGLALSVHTFQQLEQDGELRLGPRRWPARDEATLTLMMSVVLVVLLLGAGVLFLAQRRIIGMAVDLNHRVRMDIASAYGGELPAPGDWTSERAVGRALWSLQTRDARRTAIVARNLLRNTVHLGVVVVGFGALLVLDVGMTVLFLGVMAVAMISYYRTNATSARATRRYEVVAPGVRTSLRTLRTSFQSLANPAPDRAELDASLDQDAVAEETAAFRDRFGAHIHAEFLGFAIMGVALAGLTAVLGRQALAGTVPWTRVVAYVLVLRITIGGVQALLRTFAFFSRFYPSIHRLNRFFAATNGSTSEGPLASLPVPWGPETLLEHEQATQPVARGEAVEVELPVPLSRYSLGLLARVFAGDDRRRRRVLLGHIAMAAPLVVPPTGGSMSSVLGIDPAIDPGELRSCLGDQAEPIEAALGPEPRRVASAAAWGRLSDDARRHLVLAAGLLSRRPVLAVDRAMMTPQTLERLRCVAGDRIVLICGSSRSDEGAELGVARKLVVSPAGDLLAVGSPAWTATHGAVIRGPGGAPLPVGSDDDEDFDDEG